MHAILKSGISILMALFLLVLCSALLMASKHGNEQDKIDGFEEQIDNHCEEPVNTIPRLDECSKIYEEAIRFCYKNSEYRSGLDFLYDFVVMVSPYKRYSPRIKSLTSNISYIFKEKWDVEGDLKDQEDALLPIADTLKELVGYKYGALSQIYYHFVNIYGKAGYNELSNDYYDLAKGKNNDMAE